MSPRRRSGAWAAVGALVVLCTAVPAVPSAAAPGSHRQDDVMAALADPATSDAVVGLPGDRWLVPFRATEIGSALRMSGEVAETEVTLPVMEGTAPVSLDALLAVSPDVSSGYLEYKGPGVAARVVDFSAWGGRPSDVPVSLDLRGMVPTNGRLRLTINSRLRSDDPGCVTSLLGAWAELRGGGLVLSGREQEPATVSTYLPQLLGRLEVYLPAAPSDAESSAGLRIAAAAQRGAIGHDPQVTVTATGPGEVPDVPFTTAARQVVVDHTQPAEARLVSTPAGGVVLTVGGDDADLERISGLLASAWAPLAVGSVVSVRRLDPDGTDAVVPRGLPGPEPTEPDAPTTTTLPPGSDPADPANRNTRFTLADLGLGAQRLTGLGRLELPLRTTQSAFGGPVEQATVHLEGTLTPIARGADATLTMMVGNTMVSSTNLVGFEGTDSEDGVLEPGRFTLDATIGPEEIDRSLDVVVLADYSPPGGHCRPGDVPFMMQLDPQVSTVVVEPGQSLPAGFDRYPQALLPRFSAAVQDRTVDQVALAYALLLSMQRVSTEPLEGSFTSLDEALASDGPALVVAPWTRAMVATGAPLSLEPSSLSDDSRVERLRLSVNLPHGVLEAFTMGGHDRLMLTWSDGTEGDAGGGIAQARTLMDGISGRDKDFTSLYGDTYLASSGAPPLSVSLHGRQVQATPQRSTPDYLGRALPLVLAAVVLGAVVAALAWSQRRRRRRYPGAAASADPGVDDRDPDGDPDTPEHRDRS